MKVLVRGLKLSVAALGVLTLVACSTTEGTIGEVERVTAQEGQLSACVDPHAQPGDGTPCTANALCMQQCGVQWLCHASVDEMCHNH